MPLIFVPDSMWTEDIYIGKNTAVMTRGLSSGPG